MRISTRFREGGLPMGRVQISFEISCSLSWVNLNLLHSWAILNVTYAVMSFSRFCGLMLNLAADFNDLSRSFSRRLVTIIRTFPWSSFALEPAAIRFESSFRSSSEHSSRPSIPIYNESWFVNIWSSIWKNFEASLARRSPPASMDS